MDVNTFINFTNQISLINFILLVWFHTDAFLEYFKLFRLGFLFRIDKYYEYKKINPDISYIDFITIKNPNFLTKLFSCPYCLNFWLTLFSCFIFKNFLIFPLIYMFSIVIYIVLKRYIYE
jgi:hypothetical protein